MAVLRWNRTGITVVDKTSSSGINSTQFKNPWGLALDWQYNLYVTERTSHRVQKFARGSKIGLIVAGSANGVSGTSLSLLSSCLGIAVDDNENIYVAEFNNHRVTFWPRGSTSGTIVAGNGKISL